MQVWARTQFNKALVKFNAENTLWTLPVPIYFEVLYNRETAQLAQFNFVQRSVAIHVN